MKQPVYEGKITDVQGLLVGQAQNAQALTGVTVVVAGRDGATVAADVRGAASGTRETDLCQPENTVEKAHAVVLSGGSAFGLASASGVMEYLEKCKAAGHRMVVFTACVPDHCRAAMEHLGLTPYFEKVIFAQELGVDKKSPAIFRKVAESLGVKPKDCVLFDDSLVACKAAKAAGMTVVGVADAFHPDIAVDMREVCDQYISGFGDLL
jgi:FMN phosphatase YigB (HAD superfamily)